MKFFNLSEKRLMVLKFKPKLYLKFMKKGSTTIKVINEREQKQKGIKVFICT